MIPARLTRSASFIFVLLTICYAVCLSPGCGNSEPAPNAGLNPAPAGQQPKQDGTDEGARAVLGEFLKANVDHAALSKRLRPTKDDYLAVFEPEFAKKLEAFHAPAWDGGQVVIAPKAGQTQLLVNRATTEELKKWAPTAAQNFPGGYQKVAAKFKDGLTIYSFKFVQPGKTSGTAFDGLVHVNGNWRIFPKPWRAVEKE